MSQNGSQRRKRYWVCEDCGSPRLEGFWDSYTEARIDPTAKTLRMGQELRHEVHNPELPPDPASLMCINCGQAGAVRELLTEDEFEDRMAEAGVW